LEGGDGLLSAALLRDTDDGIKNQNGENDGGVDEGAPATLVLKEGEGEGNGGRAEKDDDQLVLELLEDELPDGGGWLFGDSCWCTCELVLSFRGEEKGGGPFFPCFARERVTCSSVKPEVLSTPRWTRTSSAGFA